MTAPPRRDIRALGPEGLAPLPAPEQLAADHVDSRRLALDSLRRELYALAAVIADNTLQRAWDDRSSFPPYGLARSLFSQLRVVAVDPSSFERGSIDSFEGLGGALLDTAVFRLDRELTALRRSDQAWLVDRLDQLLALYRIDAPRAAQARIRDPFSFMYGGLHFGTSLCVQLVEVMARLLADRGLSVAEKLSVLGRSGRILSTLASVNVEDIPSMYKHLHGSSMSMWLSGDRFVLHDEYGRPHRIETLPLPPARQGSPRFQTLGCPARRAPSGGPGPIAALWSWSVELAAATGLIED